MAEVSRGPVSTLPGHYESLPDGTMCDVHQDRPAKARVQGETDSFGCEYNDLCQECIDEAREHAKDERIGECEWCGQQADDLRKRRDIEEGSSGRVYDVCGKCVRKEVEQWKQEEQEYYDSIGYDPHDDY